MAAVLINKSKSSTQNLSLKQTGKSLALAVNLPAKQILDSVAIPDNINPALYIINFVGGGYVVMPADIRVEPFLAASTTGYFDKLNKLPAGLLNWVAVNTKNMLLLKKHPELKIPKSVASLWGELNAKDTSPRRVLKAIPDPPPCVDTWADTSIGPLLRTTWGQGIPYNYLCPAGDYYGFTPTGCVATAMAQVMYYWQAPTSYNWSIMPLTQNFYPLSFPGNSDVSQLMYDIGASVHMQYFNYAAGGSYPYNNPPFHPGTSCSDSFIHSFGYSSSSEGDYNYLTVMANIGAGMPVILTASTDYHSFLGINTGYNDGHTWVCDGYLQSTYTGCDGEPVLGATYLFLDMNWGWDGQSDGWYEYGYWTVLNGSILEIYQYNQTMTSNIHP